ncbi:MAG: molybdopterin-dependent oxidoreductase, partial [Actinomycetota bacterium]
VATLVIDGDEGKALKSLASGLKDKNTKEEAALLYREAENPLILCAPAFFGQAQEVSSVKGKTVAVPLEANAKGVRRLGLADGDKTYHDMVSGRNDVLYIVGEPPLDKRPKAGTLIVQTSHLTKLAETADVVLPSTAWLEADGTIIDYLGRLKRVNRAVDAPGEAKPHRDIFLAVAKAMGSSLKTPSEADIKKVSEPRSGATISSKTSKTSGTSPEEIIYKTNLSLIEGSRLSWLEEGGLNVENNRLIGDKRRA